MSSDSSPTMQRKPRRKAPIITTSQDSPKKPPSKKHVPPSPGVSSNVNISPSSQRVDCQSKPPISSASQQEIPPLGVRVDDASPHSQRVASKAKSPSSLSSQQGIVALVGVGPSGAHDNSPQAAAPDSVAAPMPKKARNRNSRSKKKVSRRQQRLQNKFLDLQAVECDSGGASVEGSENSEDDEYVPPHFSTCPFYLLNNDTRFSQNALSGISQICRT